MTVSAEIVSLAPVCAAASQVGAVGASASYTVHLRAARRVPVRRHAPSHHVTMGLPELVPLGPRPPYLVLVSTSSVAGFPAATEIEAFSPMPPLKTLLRPPILVVDDDPSILAIVCDLLTLEGYAVCTATNGAQALKVLEQSAPRLILLDMQMPVLDGWGFARVHNARRDHVPVLVMTAAVNARRWASEIDAAGYVSKPFDLNCLLDAVEREMLTG